MAFLSRSFHRSASAAALLLGLVPGASLVSAQEPLPPLQFNVPYRCADGTAYIIHRCETGRKGEVCFFRIEKNGKLETEAYNVRSRMTGWMKACPAQAGAQAGQPLNPPYLREMPSVERVRREIQGSNPTDTLARQMAVFTQLVKTVKHMMGPSRRLNSFTPDESRVIQTYELAAYEMSQAFAKAHSPDEVKAFHQLQGRYETNPALGQEAIDKLFSPALRAEYAKVEAAFEARYQAGVEADRREVESLRAQPVAAQGNSPFVRNDPGTLAARRCVELGGSDLECIGKGFMTGLFGGTITDQITGNNPARAGLTMTGRYQGESGLNISFGDDEAGVGGCGKLVADSHAYTVVKNGSRFVISVQAAPKPFVLNLGPDGQIAGPGLTDLKGRVITGYRNVWMQEYRNGMAVAGGTCGGACGYWAQEPVYADKTERCTIGALRPSGPSGTAGSLVTSILGIASGQPAGQASRDSEKDLPAPGVRMSGQYSGQGGLALEFRADGVFWIAEKRMLQGLTRSRTAQARSWST
jgi:hypothetical protein